MSEEHCVCCGEIIPEGRMVCHTCESGNSTIKYTYILRCSDNTYYTGWTNDIIKRVHKHNQGKGAKYTRARLPVELVYLEVYDTKSEAMKREYQIKQLSRREKESLIKRDPVVYSEL